MRFLLLLFTALTWARHSFANTAEHALMITAAPILQSSETQGTGAWSFGGLTRELAKAHYQKEAVSPEEYDQFMRRWLANFVATRPGIQDWVTCAWAQKPRGDSGCDSVALTPEAAPFKLLAISYRPDLAEDTCQGAEGEFRFTFALTQEPLQSRPPYSVAGTEMTVILEYALQKAAPLERDTHGWAKQIMTLNRTELCKDFCPAYQQELKALSTSITRYNPDLPAGSALGQLRSNEVVGDRAFNPALTAVLRQFGDVLTQCYGFLTADPEHFSSSLGQCRQQLRHTSFPFGPIQAASFAFNKALGALQLATNSPVPLPLPTALINTANNALAAVAAQLGLWEMREFTLQAEGLLPNKLHDTPSLAHNNTLALQDFIQEHADEVLSDRIQISQLLNQDASLHHAEIAAANPFDPWRFYSLGGVDGDIVRDARLHSHFATKTCQGCHSTQTTPNGLFLVLNDLMLHAQNSHQIAALATQLLKAHQTEELHIANIDAFYLISPLRDPGPTGQAHLAPFLTRKGGHLDALTTLLEKMVRTEGMGSCQAD